MILTLLLTVIALLPAPAALGQSPQPPLGQTRTTLAASTIEGPSRTQATFTATVESADPGASRPTGSVSFMRGSQSIGSAFLDAEGTATLTVNALPPGMQSISAVYEGDEAHQSSTSPSAEVNSATSGVAGFTLSANPTSLKVAVGSTATTIITATPENGFNQAVSLSCSGVPYVSVNCVFVPSPVTPGAPTAAAPNGTPALSTLSIQTIAPSGASLREPTGPSRSETAYAVAVPGILALAGLGLARKRAFSRIRPKTLRLLSFLMLLLAGSMALGGCNTRYGYEHHGPGYNPGTPVGNYVVTVSGITGTGSSLSTGTVAIALSVTN